MVTILTGDCRDVLKTLPDASVNCCVTSPPYWGLRDYGHAGQIGLERTPEEYVVNLVAVFREVRRALREDGTLWLNLGDSYAGYHGNSKVADADAPSNKPGYVENMRSTTVGVSGLKPKDLVGIPWRVAFALQADGWWLRSDIIWHKPNPMPESVTDRPTKSHEYIFLLTKSDRYYYDAEAIMEPVQSGPSDVRKMLESKDRIDAKHFHTDAGPLAAANHRTHIGNKRAVGGYDPSHGKARPGRDGGPGQDRRSEEPREVTLFRNKRDVWTVGTSTYDGAHFATFPPALIAPCILAGCPMGGTVLDPFGGSGTTGQVAEEDGRNSVLIELNAEYVKLAQRRTAQGGLFCSPNTVISEK
jgi:DNA modification methylase